MTIENAKLHKMYLLELQSDRGDSILECLKRITHNYTMGYDNSSFLKIFMNNLI